jgi:deoxyribodipyrimidine photo-lyase
VAIVVWFKRDLRVYDNAALVAAVARASELGVAVVPLYVVEPAYWALPDASGRHWETIAESLEELRADLGRLGAPLIVRVGNVVDILSAFHAKHGMTALVSHEEVGNRWTFDRDRRVSAWAKERSIPWEEHRQAPVLRRMGGSEDWEEWRLQFLHAPTLRPPVAIPGLPDLVLGPIPTAQQLGLYDPCPGRQPGGRRVGVACLTSFLTERGERYRWAISRPDEAEHAGGRISPHLAYGTLSVREVHRGLRGRLAQNPGENWEKSLDGFRQRVSGRDYFMQQFESNCWIEHKPILPAMDALRPLGAHPDRLEAWASGQTGWPFVDACMRSLRETGWLNFRMRAMLISVASYQLWLDWRATGLTLARLFTDYEPGIHWPMIQMQAGTNPFTVPRIYNPVKQGLDQDPKGAFVRRWCPELRTVPSTFLHEPWRWDGAARLEGCYPKPLVDLELATRVARDAVFAAHRAEGGADGGGPKGGPVVGGEQMSLPL